MNVQWIPSVGPDSWSWRQEGCRQEERGADQREGGAGAAHRWGDSQQAPRGAEEGPGQTEEDCEFKYL